MSEVIQNWTLDEMALSLKNLGENNITQSHFMTLLKPIKTFLPRSQNQNGPSLGFPSSKFYDSGKLLHLFGFIDRSVRSRGMD